MLLALLCLLVPLRAMAITKLPDHGWFQSTTDQERTFLQLEVQDPANKIIHDFSQGWPALLNPKLPTSAVILDQDDAIIPDWFKKVMANMIGYQASSVVSLDFEDGITVKTTDELIRFVKYAKECDSKLVVGSGGVQMEDKANTLMAIWNAKSTKKAILQLLNAPTKAYTSAADLAMDPDDLGWIIYLLIKAHPEAGEGLQSYPGGAFLYTDNEDTDLGMELADDLFNGWTYTGRNLYGRVLTQFRDRWFPWSPKPTEELWFANPRLPGSQKLQALVVLQDPQYVAFFGALDGMTNALGALSMTSDHKMTLEEIPRCDALIPDNIRKYFDKYGKKTFSTAQELAEEVRQLLPSVLDAKASWADFKARTQAGIQTNAKTIAVAAAPAPSKRAKAQRLAPADLEWILRFKYCLHPEVREALGKTTAALTKTVAVRGYNQYLIDGQQKPTSTRMGMYYDKASGTFEGENLVGRTWVKLREAVDLVPPINEGVLPEDPVFPEDGWFQSQDLNRPRSVLKEHIVKLGSRVIFNFDKNTTYERLAVNWVGLPIMLQENHLPSPEADKFAAIFKTLCNEPTYNLDFATGVSVASGYQLMNFVNYAMRAEKIFASNNLPLDHAVLKQIWDAKGDTGLLRRFLDKNPAFAGNIDPADLAWVFRMHFDANPAAKKLLNGTAAGQASNSKYLIWQDNSDKYLGMQVKGVREKKPNGKVVDMYEGENMYGRVLTLIRRRPVTDDFDPNGADKTWLEDPTQAGSRYYCVDDLVGRDDVLASLGKLGSAAMRNALPKAEQVKFVNYFDSLSLNSTHPIEIDTAKLLAFIPKEFQRLFTRSYQNRQLHYDTAFALEEIVRRMRAAGLDGTVGQRTKSAKAVDLLLPKMLDPSEPRVAGWDNGPFDVGVTAQDLEWILKLKYEQHQEVQKDLGQTSSLWGPKLDRYIFDSHVAATHSHLGMYFDEDERTIRGANLVGRTWMKIREGLQKLKQLAAIIEPAGKTLFAIENAWFSDLDPSKPGRTFTSEDLESHAGDVACGLAFAQLISPDVLGKSAGFKLQLTPTLLAPGRKVQLSSQAGDQFSLPVTRTESDAFGAILEILASKHADLELDAQGFPITNASQLIKLVSSAHMVRNRIADDDQMAVVLAKYWRDVRDKQDLSSFEKLYTASINKDDLLWIVELMLQGDSEVNNVVQGSVNKYIIYSTTNDDYLGMRTGFSKNAIDGVDFLVSYTGKNLYGKILMTLSVGHTVSPLQTVAGDPWYTSFMGTQPRLYSLADAQNPGVVPTFGMAGSPEEMAKLPLAEQNLLSSLDFESLAMTSKYGIRLVKKVKDKLDAVLSPRIPSEFQTLFIALIRERLSKITGPEALKPQVIGWSTAEEMVQFVRVAREARTKGLSPRELSDTLLSGLPLKVTSAASLKAWRDSVSGYRQPISQEDLEWILWLKYDQNPRVQADIAKTSTLGKLGSDRLLLNIHLGAGTSKYGMTYDKLGGVLRGENVLGRTWMKIRKKLDDDGKLDLKPLFLKPWPVDDDKVWFRNPFDLASKDFAEKDTTRNRNTIVLSGKLKLLSDDAVEMKGENMASILKPLFDGLKKSDPELIKFRTAGHAMLAMRAARALLHDHRPLADRVAILEAQYKLLKATRRNSNSLDKWRKSFEAAAGVVPVPVLPVDLEAVLRAKILQHSTVDTELKATAKQLLIHEGDNAYLGMVKSGPPGQYAGVNLLGRMWMRIRLDIGEFVPWPGKATKVLAGNPLYYWINPKSTMGPSSMTIREAELPEDVVHYFGSRGDAVPGNLYGQLAPTSNFELTMDVEKLPDQMDVKFQHMQQVMGRPFEPIKFPSLAHAFCFLAFYDKYTGKPETKVAQTAALKAVLGKLLRTPAEDVYKWLGTASLQYAVTESPGVNLTVASQKTIQDVLTFATEVNPALSALLAGAPKYLFNGHLRNDTIYGMHYDPATGTYKGENRVGFAWMKVKSLPPKRPFGAPGPLVKDWAANIGRSSGQDSPSITEKQAKGWSAVPFFGWKGVFGEIPKGVPLPSHKDRWVDGTTEWLHNKAVLGLELDPAALPVDLGLWIQAVQKELPLSGTPLVFTTAEHAIVFTKAVRALLSNTVDAPVALQKLATGYGTLISKTAEDASAWLAKFCEDSNVVPPEHPTLPDLEAILRAKCEKNPAVKSDLDGTKPRILMYGNQEGDDYLGMVYDLDTLKFTGANKLGRLWMRIRKDPGPYVPVMTGTVAGGGVVALPSAAVSSAPPTIVYQTDNCPPCDDCYCFNDCSSALAELRAALMAEFTEKYAQLAAARNHSGAAGSLVPRTVLVALAVGAVVVGGLL